jgi:hypothetical protein
LFVLGPTEVLATVLNSFQVCLFEAYFITGEIFLGKEKCVWVFFRRFKTTKLCVAGRLSSGVSISILSGTHSPPLWIFLIYSSWAWLFALCVFIAAYTLSHHLPRVT